MNPKNSDADSDLPDNFRVFSKSTQVNGDNDIQERIDDLSYSSLELDFENTSNPIRDSEIKVLSFCPLLTKNNLHNSRGFQQSGLEKSIDITVDDDTSYKHIFCNDATKPYSINYPAKSCSETQSRKNTAHNINTNITRKDLPNSVDYISYESVTLSLPTPSEDNKKINSPNKAQSIKSPATSSVHTYTSTESKYFKDIWFPTIYAKDGTQEKVTKIKLCEPETKPRLCITNGKLVLVPPRTEDRICIRIDDPCLCLNCQTRDEVTKQPMCCPPPYIPQRACESECKKAAQSQTTPPPPPPKKEKPEKKQSAEKVHSDTPKKMDDLCPPKPKAKKPCPPKSDNIDLNDLADSKMSKECIVKVVETIKSLQSCTNTPAEKEPPCPKPEANKSCLNITISKSDISEAGCEFINMCEKNAKSMIEAHDETMSTLKCAMNDLVCKVIHKTQDAVSLIKAESCRQLDSLRRNNNQSETEKKPPKKCSATASYSRLMRDSGNYANIENSVDINSITSKRVMDNISMQLDSTISFVSDKMEQLKINNDKKSLINDQEPTNISNVNQPHTTANISMFTSIKSKIWSMFGEGASTENLKGNLSVSSTNLNADLSDDSLVDY